MRVLKNIFLLIILNICFHSIAQNQRAISGQVLDIKTKKPLAGATVLIQNSGIGSITDANGKFSYTIKEKNIPNTVLTISYIGYEIKNVRVGNATTFTIFLEQDDFTLDNVVITSSYGTKKRKEEAVGAITTVKAAELQVRQVAESFDKMLDGVAAGVLITGSSTIGSPVKIEIRGQGTLTPLNGNLTGTSTQPLIIIDGVIMSEEKGFDSQLFDGGAGSEQFKNPLAKISPEDIEELTILKDAAAVGIYGADAANGVILVTTKKGKSKKPSFTFATQTGFSAPINQIKYLSGPQFYDIKKEYLISQGQSESQASGNAGSRLIDTDWFNLLNRNGSFNRYNFNASFGSRNWNFRSSFNALLNEEPQKSNNFKRYGGNINVGFAKNKLSIQTSITPAYTVQNEPNTLFGFPLPPNIAAYNADGSFSSLGYAGFGNPLAVAAQNTNETNVKSMLASVNASYAFTKNLKIGILFGTDFSDKYQTRYFSGENESGQFNGTFQAPNENNNLITYPNWGRRFEFYRDSFRWNQSTTIMYERKEKLHSFDGLLGLEMQSERTESRRVSGTGFVNPNVVNPANEAKKTFSDNSLLSEDKRRSIFSQFNYNYNKRYFVLLNIRRDESSAFGSDVNAALNGGFGLSWNVSNENFLKKNKTIDFLRLRTSFGVTGNSRIGSYRALGLYNLDVTGNDGYNGGTYATPSTAPNPNLSWERNYKFNIGLDFNFLEKFKITGEFFIDNRNDIITSETTPAEIGFTSIQINGASMVNQGVELTLQANWIKNPNFAWTTNFNISKIQNKVTDLNGFGETFSVAALGRAQKIGVSTSAIWGAPFAGIDQATGRELFFQNGQLYDAASYSNLFTVANAEIIGDSAPDFFGGIQNSFTFFKKLNLGIRASYRYGDSFTIDDELVSQYRVIVNRNLSVNAIDHWRQQGDITQNPSVTDNNPIISNSSRFLYDASHIKIQNVNLSYVVAMDKMNVNWIKSVNFFMDISNVFYFYKTKSPADRNGVAEFRFKYPEARTLTFGFQANF